MERKKAAETLTRLFSMQAAFSAAGGDLVCPEGEPRGVGLAVEEVEVVLPDEEGRGRRWGSSSARPASLSMMVNSAVFGLPSPTPAPVGFESMRSTISLAPSSKRSFTIRTRKVFEVSPGAKLSVPSAIS